MLAEADFNSSDTVEPASPTIDRGLDFSNSPSHTDQSTKTNPSHRNNNVISDPSGKKLQIHSAGKLRNSDKHGLARLDSNSSVGSNSSKRRSGESLELIDDYYSQDSSGNTQVDRKLRSDSSSGSEHMQQQVVLMTNSDMLTGVTTYQAVQASWMINSCKHYILISINDVLYSVSNQYVHSIIIL